ncbi:MAG TPA: hypothetical protein VG815_20370 [Chloroflexota bacterium]|nr:hypothetical protein [Chloroflexota bacterium]
MTSEQDFQRRAGEEGRQVQDIAGKVLRGAGFTDLRANEVLKDLGVTVNFIGLDQANREWCFDVSGAFTSSRAGLIRTDTMWKTLGRANVLHQVGVQRLVLLTTNLPKPNSTGHHALSAAASTFFDAIEMLTPEGKARLALYAQAAVNQPLPGLRPASQLYSGLTSRTIGAELQIRVPLVEVASALPARASVDLVVMPNRLKVFLPSKTASGAPLDRSVRQASGERIRTLLSTCAGGCTLSPGLGSWLDPIGGEMFEDVILVESYAENPFPDAVVSAIVQVLVDDLGQHTAALIVNDAMIHITPR